MQEHTSLTGVPDERSLPLSDFVGREWVLSRIATWLAGEDPRFLLVGPAGSGKSMVAARLVERGVPAAGAVRAPHGWHFCRAGDRSTLLAENVLKGIAERLADNLDRYRELLLAGPDRSGAVVSVRVETGSVQAGATVTAIGHLTIELAHTDPERIADELIRRPLGRLAADGLLPDRVLIVVDGLDECLGVASGEDTIDVLSTLSRPGAGLPGQVRFLCTTRADGRVLGRTGPGDLQLVDDAPGDQRDLVEYAERRLTGLLGADQAVTLAGRVAAAAQENFLCARYLLTELAADPGRFADPAAGGLPAGLDQIYRAFLERELTRRHESWSSRYRPLLGLLTVAQGDGLGREDLAGASGLRLSQVDDAMRALTQYVVGSYPGPYRIYHQSFRDFLLTTGDYPVYPDESERDLTRYLLAGCADWTAAAPYAIQYLARHAAQCGLLPEALRAGLLAHADPRTMRAALHLDGTHPDLTATYEAAFPDLVGESPGQRALALLAAAARTSPALTAELRPLLPPPDADVRWSTVSAAVAPTWRHPSSMISYLSLGQVRGAPVAVFTGLTPKDGLHLWFPERDELRVWPFPKDLPEPLGMAMFVREAGSRVIAGCYGTRGYGGAFLVDAETGEVLHAAWSPELTALVWQGPDPWLVETRPLAGMCQVWVRPAGRRSQRRGYNAWVPVAVLPSLIVSLHPLTCADSTVALRTENEIFLLRLDGPAAVLSGPLPAPGSSGGCIADIDYAGRTLLAVPMSDGSVQVMTADDGAVLSLIPVGRMRQRAGPDPAIDDLHFVVAEDGPHLLVQERGGDLRRWDMAQHRFLADVWLPLVGAFATVGLGDRAILGALMPDGIHLYDYGKLTGHDDRLSPYPTELIAAGRFGTDRLVASLAAGPAEVVLSVTDVDSGVVREQLTVLRGRELRGSLLALGRVRDRRAAIVVVDPHHAGGRLCWLGESVAPVPFDLTTGFAAAEMAGFRLVAVATGPHLRGQFALVSLLRGLDQLPDHGVIVIDSGRWPTVGMFGEYEVHTVVDRGAEGFATALIRIDLHVRNLVAVSHRGEVHAALTTESARSVIVHVSGTDARITHRLRVEGYLPTVALGIRDGQVLLAAGDTTGARLLPITGGPLTEPLRIPFIPTALAFADNGDLLIGLDHGMVAVRPAAPDPSAR